MRIESKVSIIPDSVLMRIIQILAISNREDGKRTLATSVAAEKRKKKES